MMCSIAGILHKNNELKNRIANLLTLMPARKVGIESNAFGDAMNWNSAGNRVVRVIFRTSMEPDRDRPRTWFPGICRGV